jgi:hypothetical protein
MTQISKIHYLRLPRTLPSHTNNISQNIKPAPIPHQATNPLFSPETPHKQTLNSHLKHVQEAHNSSRARLFLNSFAKKFMLLPLLQLFGKNLLFVISHLICL